jgi:hypothetical protein
MEVTGCRVEEGKGRPEPTWQRSMQRKSITHGGQIPCPLALVPEGALKKDRCEVAEKCVEQFAEI